MIDKDGMGETFSELNNLVKGNQYFTDADCILIARIKRICESSKLHWDSYRGHLSEIWGYDDETRRPFVDTHYSPSYQCFPRDIDGQWYWVKPKSTPKKGTKKGNSRNRKRTHVKVVKKKVLRKVLRCFCPDCDKEVRFTSVSNYEIKGGYYLCTKCNLYMEK